MYNIDDNRPHVEVFINNNKIVGLLDSGANCTILGKGSLALIKELKLVKYSHTNFIKTADGTLHSANISVDIPITFNNKTIVMSVLAVPTLSKKLILGMDFWTSFKIKPIICNEINCDTDINQRKLNSYQSNVLKSTISKFKSFSGEGLLPRTHVLNHEIDTGLAKPVKQRYYPVSPYIQKEMYAELDRMIGLGVVEKSNSSWSNPIVGVRKSNGKLRLCLDSRVLNSVTKTLAFPLPYISRILGQLKGTKFLSKLDLSDAFWQIPLAEKDREKTAFTIPGRGLYQFVVMPFGLHGAPQTQSRLMDQVLGYDLEPRVFVYLDDIVIATDTYEDHIRCLEEVGKRLKDANLAINLAKSKFCQLKIQYLGYIIDENGINTDPDKVSAIVDYPRPRNVTETRRLMGMIGWYRKFIPNFSSISAPITDLLKKTTKTYKWTLEADNAFNLLKTALVTAPVLCTPDFDKPFVIQTDASAVGVGAMLTQGESNEKIIACMSQKLSSAQSKYTAMELECLAVLLAIEKFRPYIEGVKFTVITDNASLLWLKNLKDPSGRLARWALRLQQYEYTLIHRKGKFNVVADALSRSVELIDLEEDLFSGDEWYEGLMKRVLEFPKNYPAFRVENDLIFKCSKNHKGGEFKWKLVIPTHRRIPLIKNCHDTLISGHGGVNKTIQRIKTRFFWPGMNKTIKDYVRRCEVCQTCKHSTQTLRHEIGEPKQPQLPWEMLSIDFIGPLPRSKKGNTMLLVVLDVFSKYVLLHPMRSATAEGLVRYLEENVFMVYGVPNVIVSDNGPQLTANKYKAFLDEYKVKPWYTCYYLPQANPVERANQSIKTAIRMFIQDSRHVEWDKNLPQIGCALRSSVHSATHFTPYYANFGKEMVTSGGLHKLDDQLSSFDTKKPDRLFNLNKIRTEISENLLKAYETYAKRYNLRSRIITFTPGEIVLRANFNLSDAIKGYTSGLGAKYIKAKIKEKLGTSSYLLTDMSGKDIGKYSVKHLRKFISN